MYVSKKSLFLVLGISLISLPTTAMAGDLLAHTCDKGDVDGNGRIDLRDGRAAARLGMGMTDDIMRFGYRSSFADINNDGKIDKSDTELIVQAALGGSRGLQALGCK